MSSYDAILEYVETLEIVDTHEHLPNEAEWARGHGDVLCEWLRHYFPCDLVSAGLAPASLSRALDTSRPLLERWAILEPFWNAARNTGYARALDLAARDLYGLPCVSAETIRDLNEAFLARRAAASNGESHYKYVLKEKSRIAVSLTDRLGDRDASADAEYFRPVFRLEGVIDLNTPQQLEALGEKTGSRIHSLGDYKDAALAAVESAVDRGAVALKIPFAYSRPIRFRKATAAAAEEAFNAIFRGPSGPDVGTLYPRRMRPLEDHMVHHVLRFADRRGLAVQVHTGLQEGNGNVLSNSNPLLLDNLFLEYSGVTFDIFHISYPWQHVLAALAKNFRNVMIDFCWAHIISPEASVRALVEYLDSVPANKISAFGGDYLFPDGVYGHQYMARRNVSRALAIKVDEGVFDVERAKELARWLFIDNPARIFHLEL